MMTIYQYPKCSTCRKALAWLDARNVPYRSVDIVSQPPSPDTLRQALARSQLPIAKLFNTSGQSYRLGGFRQRLPDMTPEEAIAALAADGKLIKRPLVVAEDFALIGFREADFESRFG